MGFVGSIVMAVAVVQAAPALSVDERDVNALVAEATAAQERGEFVQAVAIAERAIARARVARVKSGELEFLSARRWATLVSFSDTKASPEAFQRLAEVGARTLGANAFSTEFARFKGVEWAYRLRRPGTGFAEMQVAAEAIAARARSNEEQVLAAMALANLAVIAAGAGDLVNSRPVFDRARALADSLPNTADMELAMAYINLGTFALRDDKPGIALALSDRAIGIAEAERGPMTHFLITPLSNKASASRALGDIAAADALLRRAVGIVDAAPALSGTFRARTLMDYAQFLASAGRHEQAAPLIERAVEHVREEPPRTAMRVSIPHSAGGLCLDAGRYRDALRHLGTALAASRDAGDTGLTQGRILADIGRAELRMGNAAAAQATATRAMEAVDAAAPAGHSARGTVRLLLAELAEARGQGAEAIALYTRAIDELPSGGADAAAVGAARIRLASLLARDGRLDEAGWRGARAGGDTLITGVARASALPGSDPIRLSIAPEVLDRALDVAWARDAAVGKARVSSRD